VARLLTADPGLGATRAVDREPRGLCECAGQDGVDKGSPRWPGGGETVKRLCVAGLNGGGILAMDGGMPTYTVQPEKRRKDRAMAALTWSGRAAVRRPNSTRGSSSGARECQGEVGVSLGRWWCTQNWTEGHGRSGRRGERSAASKPR
jgi:hypothetical protein